MIYRLSKRRGPAFRSRVETLEPRIQLSTSTGGTLAVQLTPSANVASFDQLASSAGASTQSTSIPGLVTVQGSSASLAQVSAAIAGNPAVEYSTPQQTVSVALAPNDPEYTSNKLWGLNGNAGIQAPGAWNVATSSAPTVTIADIDTGADYNHVDLYQNIWINQAEIPVTRMQNLVDVYHDGYISWRDLNNPINIGPGKITDLDGDGVITAADILSPMILNAQGQDTGTGGWANPNNVQDGDTAHPDDLIGWNFVANNNNPLDDNGHGTHTAGIIAAMGNNGIGVTGVNWSAQVMLLKFLDASGSGSDTAAAQAIAYAAAHGAKVANASWGSSTNDPVLSTAISNASAQGLILVAAAGNNGQNSDVTPFYPAGYNLPNIVSVGAIQSDGTRAGFSNYGASSVDLFAPGVSIESTLPKNTYGYLSGTSMAAPYVTGTIALLQSLHPTWTYSQVINQVLANTTPDPSVGGQAETGGILDAATALAPGAAGTASFVGADTTTVGNWSAGYGADGYEFAQDTSGTNPKLPSYAQLSVTGAQVVNLGALEPSPYSLQNIAGTGTTTYAWSTATTLDINLNLTDGQAHRVSLYLTDPANSLKFRLIDSTTGTVLDTRTPAMNSGTYLSWNLQGRVTLQVTNLGPQSSAYVDAILFGAAVQAPTATASFTNVDATTQGSWKGVYGGDGFDISSDPSANDPTLPSYLSGYNISGAISGVWIGGSSTGDIRALQKAASGSTDRVASFWTSNTSFSINLNLTDGQTHRLALYALDWDNYMGGRTERIDVLDTATGTLLNSQTLSGFQGGTYLVWNVKGNITVVVTNLSTSGSNAVLSGIFLG